MREVKAYYTIYIQMKHFHKETKKKTSMINIYDYCVAQVEFGQSYSYVIYGVIICIRCAYHLSLSILFNANANKSYRTTVNR